MRLYQIWLANIALLSLFRFYFVPRLQRYIEHHRSYATIKKRASLAVVSWAETILLLGAISGGLVFAFVLWFQFAGGASAAAVGHVIERLQEGRRWLSGFGMKWDVIVLAFGTIALGVYAHRRGKLRMTQAFDAVRDRELDRLGREASEGKWENLPPTAEMRRVSDHAEKLLTILQNSGDASIHGQVISELERLKEIYFSLDLQRRIDMRLSPEEASLPVPQTRWEIVETVFISRGLWGVLSRPARLAYLCNFALLIPSLIGIYSLPASAIFEQRFVQLAELQVELSQKEALVAWQQFLPAAKEDERKLDDDEVQTVKHASRVFEHSFSDSDQFKSFRVSSPSNEHEIRSALARKSILHAAAEASPESVAEVHPKSAFEAMDAKKRAVWEGFQDFDPEAPPTAAGKQVFDDLAAQARRKPPGFIANLKASLQTPMAQCDIASTVGRKAFAALFGEHLGDAGEFLSGIDPIKRKAFADSLATKSRRYVVEILRTDGAGVEEAIAAVNKPYARDLAPGPMQQFQEFTREHQFARGNGDDLIATLREHPPALDPAPDRRIDRGRVVEIIRPHVTGSDIEKLNKAFRYSQPLAEFSSYFPASKASYLDAFDSSTVQKLVGSIDRTQQILDERASTLGKSARVFEGLKGFSKVGGVLIGIPPEGSQKALDYVGFRWEVNGAKVRFILTDHRDKSSVSRWWDACIAHQALTYAADGRPLTVTIVNCSPLMDQKVLLHAALVDTGLGHRLMELDHFVNDYVWEGKDNPDLTRDWKEADELVKGHVELYEYALERRSLVVARKLLRLITDDDKRLLSDDIVRWEASQRNAERSLPTGEPSTTAQALARGSDAFDDKKRSILTAKPAYFEQALVKSMGAAAKSNRALPEFGLALDREFEAAFSSDMKKNIELLSAQPPSISMVSGVRENPFRVEPASFFVEANAATPEILDYVVQVTFETRAKGDSENKSDADPWQFPLLAKRIRAAVATGIATDARTRAIHESANEFAFLQRFFRLAFNGSLGTHFPVERLAIMGRDLRRAAPPATVHTIRWNTRPGAHETVIRDYFKKIVEGATPGREMSSTKQVCSELLPLLDEMAVHSRSLDAAATSAADLDDAWAKFAAAQQDWMGRWRPQVDSLVSQWNSSRDGSENTKSIFAIIDNLRIAQDLRAALGVAADDEQCWLDKAAKPLPPVSRAP